VRSLLRHRAPANRTKRTNSKPLSAACFHGHWREPDSPGGDQPSLSHVPHGLLLQGPPRDRPLPAGAVRPSEPAQSQWQHYPTRLSRVQQPGEPAAAAGVPDPHGMGWPPQDPAAGATCDSRTGVPGAKRLDSD
uniref:Uncharacterized protein n=1 Tax=Theropithecus gelada TaxID=9565 RepID=A0A8D2EBY3_THEGE